MGVGRELSLRVGRGGRACGVLSWRERYGVGFRLVRQQVYGMVTVNDR